MGGVGTPVDQQFALRWNDFQTSILSSFRHLKDEEDFVDVTLACDGCSFTAHKVVLSACSPYFKTLLKANPCEHPIVILRDVKEHDMEALLSFMYNGEVRIAQDQLQEFLKTAQTLQVRGLTDVPPKDHYKLLSNSTYNVPWSTPSSSAESHSNFHSTNNDSPLSPPPSKRSRSAEPPLYPHSPHTPNHNDHAAPSRESLLGQALESVPHHHHPSSNQNKSAVSDSPDANAHSSGEESNSSDTALSERGAPSHHHHHQSLHDLMNQHPKSEQGDYPTNDHLGMDPSRNNFPAALLSLQGLPGLLPGPSGMHNSPENNFVSRRGLDMMRVRATDPRPCPKCGKIYRSAHTLRTHLEDKHTVCPGYRCVLCGTVAKSRNSLHSHMSRQHRGISTKDLPVLPMPSPFDPELASQLLAKAGVKVSAAELRARSSPTGMLGNPQRTRLDLKSTGSSMCGGEDPEDLTVNNNNKDNHRMYGLDIRPLSPPSSHYGNSTAVITKVSPSGGHHSIPQSPKEARGPPGPSSTGSVILDTYLQFIAENSSLNLSAEQLAAKVNEEQRRILSNHHAMMTNEHDYSSAGEEDEYSEEEGPEPIKAGE